MKFQKDNKYLKIAIYCIATIAVSAFIVYLIFNLDNLPNIINTISNVLSPFIYGFLIAFLLNPLLKFFENTLFKNNEKRARWKRYIGVLCTYLVIIAVITLLLAIIVPQLKTSYVELTNNFSSYLNSLLITLDKFIQEFPLFNGEFANANEFFDANEFSTDLKNIITNVFNYISANINSITSRLFNVVIELKNILVGLIASVYFLIAKDRIAAQTKKIISSLVSRRHYLNVISVARFTNQTVGGFVFGKIIDSIIIGILTFILFTIFKMPYTPILSVVVGVTNVIPFFGPFIGGIPAVIIVLISEPSKALTAALLILIIQQLDGNLIGPHILGDSTGISALGVLVSITIGGGFFGFLGMFFGVPIYAVLRELYVQHLNRKLIKHSKSKDLKFYYTDPPVRDYSQEAILIDKKVEVNDIIVDYSSITDDTYIVPSGMNRQKIPRWAVAIEKLIIWIGKKFKSLGLLIFKPIKKLYTAIFKKEK